jgi:hypothetical protein
MTAKKESQGFLVASLFGMTANRNDSEKSLHIIPANLMTTTF